MNLELTGPDGSTSLCGGHEGVGTIVAIADATTTDLQIGDPVGMKWQVPVRQRVPSPDLCSSSRCAQVGRLVHALRLLPSRFRIPLFESQTPRLHPGWNVSTVRSFVHEPLDQDPQGTRAGRGGSYLVRRGDRLQGDQAVGDQGRPVDRFT